MSSCTKCKHGKKAVIKASQTQEGESKQFIIHYCAVTNNPQDVVDPFVERHCDDFDPNWTSK